MVVLDEADEMLNMGFIEDIEKFLRKHQKKSKRCYSQQRCLDEFKVLLNVL